MRRACVSTVRSPSPTLSLLPGGWGVAPLARSTPTLWAYAQRNAHKDTPKKSKLSTHNFHLLFFAKPFLPPFTLGNISRTYNSFLLYHR
ncbi:MAG: hypothetical protein NZ455_13705 [Bacteroidia bacterium]|nr:hypothetical protein [Bacteroidia bacterium]MDW8345588.1 hypothetical protein [Bacteroidia bacterium]